MSCKKENAAPLKLSRMHGAQRLLVLANYLHGKSALTIASSRAFSTRDRPRAFCCVTCRWPGTCLSCDENSCRQYMKSCENQQRQLREASQHHNNKSCRTHTMHTRNYVNTYTAVIMVDKSMKKLRGRNEEEDVPAPGWSLHLR